MLELSRALVFVSAALDLAALFLFVLEKAKKNELFRKLGFIFWSLGAISSLGCVIVNYLINGYMPFVSIYQILIFLSLCFIAVWGYMRTLCDLRDFHLYFSIASCVVSLGPCFMDSSAVWTFPPALQSPWFIPHIVVYMIAYSLGAVAFIVTIASYINKKDEYIRASYLLSRTLFPFMTCGMLFGAIWADQVWGDFWSWDIKEAWSLVTWLTFALALHAFRRAPLKKLARPLVLLGFAGIIITFLFVNVIGGSTHAYS